MLARWAAGRWPVRRGFWPSGDIGGADQADPPWRRGLPAARRGGLIRVLLKWLYPRAPGSRRRIRIRVPSSAPETASDRR